LSFLRGKDVSGVRGEAGKVLDVKEVNSG